MIQVMALYRLFGWLLGYSFYGLPYLLSGLFVACLYIIYDTQIIVERAERGDKDVPAHTMMLFVDLFELFIRILQILIELNKDKESDRRKRKNWTINSHKLLLFVLEEVDKTLIYFFNILK